LAAFLFAAQIHLFVDKSLSRLKGSDRTLPQILRLRQMLKRGLGVHHAGGILSALLNTHFYAYASLSLRYLIAHSSTWSASAPCPVCYSLFAVLYSQLHAAHIHPAPLHKHGKWYTALYAQGCCPS